MYCKDKFAFSAQNADFQAILSFGWTAMCQHLYMQERREKRLGAQFFLEEKSFVEGPKRPKTRLVSGPPCAQ